MAQQYSFDALSRFIVAAVVACLPLLAASVACQSESDDDEGVSAGDPGEGTAGALSASPQPTNVPPRDDSSAPPAGGGGVASASPAAAGGAAAGSPAGASSAAPVGASAGAAGASNSET